MFFIFKQHLRIHKEKYQAHIAPQHSNKYKQAPLVREETIGTYIPKPSELTENVKRKFCRWANEKSKPLTIGQLVSSKSLVQLFVLSFTKH